MRNVKNYFLAKNILLAELKTLLERHMNKITHIYLLRIIIINILFTSCLYADTTKVLNIDYIRLCNIYDEVVNQPVDLTTKEMHLTEDVYNKLPHLFNHLFKHVIRSNADKRYDLIKQYAKQQNNYIWKCESARLYYINDFK